MLKRWLVHTAALYLIHLFPIFTPLCVSLIPWHSITKGLTKAFKFSYVDFITTTAIKDQDFWSSNQSFVFAQTGKTFDPLGHNILSPAMPWLEIILQMTSLSFLPNFNQQKVL